MVQRLIVMGGGPAGIAAALGAIDRGFDVTLLERDAIGASLYTWGPTRFFTPVRMNVTARMREILGRDMPAGDALLTGPEFADRVLRPLSVLEPLAGKIRTGHRVVAIGRRGLTRGDLASHPLRAERPFRLLVETPQGDEALEAEAVLDATGGLAIPKPFGSGGVPAIGERSLDGAVIRSLAELSRRRADLSGKRVLLIGDGHSAANAISVMESIAWSDSGTRVAWAVRGANRRPCEEVANDPLTERQSVVSHANALAESPPAFLTMERRVSVERIVSNADLEVTFAGGRRAHFDVIAAFTGYRPETGYLSELNVETSPVTEGTARLYRAISNITDCLAVPRVSPRDLESGEPNFYFVGSRSYGRSNAFLLQSGLQQLETILEALPS